MRFTLKAENRNSIAGSKEFMVALQGALAAIMTQGVFCFHCEVVKMSQWKISMSGTPPLIRLNQLLARIGFDWLE
jgi:hypothetical protein